MKAWLHPLSLLAVVSLFVLGAYYHSHKVKTLQKEVVEATAVATKHVKEATAYASDLRRCNEHADEDKKVAAEELKWCVVELNYCTDVVKGKYDKDRVGMEPRQ